MLSVLELDLKYYKIYFIFNKEVMRIRIYK